MPTKNTNENEAVVIAEKDQRPTRFIYGYTDDDDDSAIYMAIIVVEEAYRGREVGKVLVGRFEDLARGRKFPKITLTVADGNKAITLYSRLSYEKTDFPSRFANGYMDMFKSL